MRRALPLLAFLVWVTPANAAPSVTVQASATLGQAPLDVTLTATGDAVAYHWDLGDRTLHGDRHGNRDGRQHSPGFVTITSARLTLTGPKVGTYGKRTTLRGQIVPALRGAPIALYSGETAVKTGKVNRKGRFRFHVRQTAASAYSVRFESVASNAVALAVRPGFLPSGMFYSSFPVGAFAIHGYPSVPPYPASHGCVRIPMWIAPRVFASNSYGEPVFIYY